MRSITEKEVLEMFTNYIARKRYHYQSSSSSPNAIYNEGECHEAEKWLKLCGVNVEKDRITDFVNGTRHAYDYNFDLIKHTDTDFILLSSHCYMINDIKSYIAIYLTDSEEDEDNITAYVLAVPLRERWSNSCTDEIMYAVGLEDSGHEVTYADAIECGPKATLWAKATTESGSWENMQACKSALEYANALIFADDTYSTAGYKTPTYEFIEDGETAWQEIIGK